VADDGHGLSLVESETGDDGRVIGEMAVAVDLDEILEEIIYIIQRVRPLGMAGDLDDLPGGELRADLGPLLFDLLAELGDLLLFPRIFPRLELIDLVFELKDIFLELVKVDSFGHRS
jgi:hypothetical protein